MHCPHVSTQLDNSAHPYHRTHLHGESKKGVMTNRDSWQMYLNEMGKLKEGDDPGALSLVLGQAGMSVPELDGPQVRGLAPLVSMQILPPFPPNKM